MIEFLNDDKAIACFVQAKEGESTEAPWENEPDRLEGEHRGYKWLILRNTEIKNLCGYVGLPEGHPWYGVHYDKLDELCDVNVHGGLTYSDEGDGEGTAEWGGRPKGCWWIGLDCAHLNDLCPGMMKFYGQLPSLRDLAGELRMSYKDIAFVQKECENLIDQIIDGLKWWKRKTIRPRRWLSTKWWTFKYRLKHRVVAPVKKLARRFWSFACEVDLFAPFKRNKNQKN